MCQVFIQKLEHQSGKLADWVRDLLCRKSNFVVTCALANKLARIAPGPNGTTANLCSITAEIHRFKELLIWFCEY